MKFELNYNSVPTLSTAFSRAKTPVARCIQFVRGGREALKNECFPNHSLLVTEDRGQKFATEETARGLVESSLDQYLYSNNRIIAVLYWSGWDDTKRRNEALDYLATIRRRQGDPKNKIGKYDLKGLFSFVPVIGKCFKPDPVQEWCSENCASIHKKFGAPWIDKTEIAPDQLLKIMMRAPDVRRILNFYKYEV